MDYRSIIHLSYENKQNAQKEVKKSSDASSTKLTKKSGPSNEAVKRFLENKKKQEVEWFKRIKVDKPPPEQPKKKQESTKGARISKESNSVAHPNETKSVVHPNEKKPKVLSNGITPVITTHESNKPLKKKDVYPLKNPAVEEKKKKLSASFSEKRHPPATVSDCTSSSQKRETDHKKETKASVLPSFTNYQKLIQMANRNSEKPPKFLADPELDLLKEEKKKKQQLRDTSYVPLDVLSQKPRRRKRKSERTDTAVASEDPSEPVIKKKKRIDSVPPEKASAKSDKHEGKHSTSGSSSKDTPAQESKVKNIYSRHYISDAKPSQPPPVRGGIAAQLSLSSGGASKFNASSSVSRPSESHIKIQNSSSNKGEKKISSALSKKIDERGHTKPSISTADTAHHSKVKAQSEVRLPNNDSKGYPTKKGIAAQNGIFKAPPPPSITQDQKESRKPIKPKKNIEVPKKSSAPHGAMSVTMEDDDSSFVHITKKPKIDHKPAAPPVAPSVKARGIAAQNGVPAAPPVAPSMKARGIAAQNGASFGGAAPVRRGIAAQYGLGGGGNAGSGSKMKPYQHGYDSEDEYEDEYDEDDDFIDDSEVVTENQYQNYVEEIHRSLRFDPSKYESVKPWDDCRSMETNFREIEKEEKRSARLGMKEDLEDIRAEEERLKKKKKKK